MKVKSFRARAVLNVAGSDRVLSDEIDYLEEAKIVQAASARDTTLAARIGLSLTESGTVTSYIAKYSKNLRRGIENTARFHNIFHPALRFSLRSSGNHVSMEFEWKDFSYARFHRHTEFLIFGALARMRYLTRTDFYPLEIRFDHKVGKSADAFSRIGGFPVSFGAEQPEILMSHTTLDLPIPTYDPILRDYLTDYSERLVHETKASKPGLRGRIEGQISASLPEHMPTAEDVAASLGMSPRTLARRLKEQGLTYRKVVDELRYALAQAFLNDGMRLSEISFALGYSDQAAFSSAYKRWSGRSPSSAVGVSPG